VYIADDAADLVQQPLLLYSIDSDDPLLLGPKSIPQAQGFRGFLGQRIYDAGAEADFRPRLINGKPRAPGIDMEVPAIVFSSLLHPGKGSHMDGDVQVGHTAVEEQSGEDAQHRAKDAPALLAGGLKDMGKVFHREDQHLIWAGRREGSQDGDIIIVDNPLPLPLLLFQEQVKRVMPVLVGYLPTALPFPGLHRVGDSGDALALGMGMLLGSPSKGAPVGEVHEADDLGVPGLAIVPPTSFQVPLSG